MSFSKHVSIFILLFVIVQIDAWKRCTKFRTHIQRFNEDKTRKTPITRTRVGKIEEEKSIKREVVMNLYFSTTISKVINRQSTWTISDMKFDSINKTMYYPLWLTMRSNFVITFNTTGHFNKTQCRIQGGTGGTCFPPQGPKKKLKIQNVPYVFDQSCTHPWKGGLVFLRNMAFF